MDDETVVDLLCELHNRIVALVQVVQRHRGEQRRAAFQQLLWAYAVHETVEKEVVHPATRTDKSGDQIVDQHMHEESEIGRTLADLHERGVDWPGFDAQFSSLAENITAHTEQKEREEFSRLKLLPVDRLKSPAHPRSTQVSAANASNHDEIE